MAAILLVEDDPLISRMLSMRLEAQGYTVDSADNGRVGVDKALGGEFDLVLLDMHMPVMDGHEAVKYLRKNNYTQTVVAVTASAMSTDSQEAINAGCNYFISKPIGNDFEQQIADILQNRA